MTILIFLSVYIVYTMIMNVRYIVQCTEDQYSFNHIKCSPTNHRTGSDIIFVQGRASAVVFLSEFFFAHSYLQIEKMMKYTFK